MSEQLDTKAIAARLAAATPGPWNVRERWYEDSAPDWVVGGLKARGRDGCGMTKEDADFIAHAPADIAALLAENERLQRERSEWCDQADRRLTDYMTQQRDLLAEVAALRARLTLTPEKIEAAAKAQYEFDNPGGPEFKACTFRCLYLGASRAALLAAGMQEAQP